MCLSTGGAWVAGGPCMVGGRVWQGDMHGRETCMVRGCAWQGACVAGGHVWQGACMVVGGAWQGACMAGGVLGMGACMTRVPGGGMCGMHTPRWHYEIRSVNARTVHIILKCILVVISFGYANITHCLLRISKRATTPKNGDFNLLFSHIVPENCIQTQHISQDRKYTSLSPLRSITVLRVFLNMDN